MIWRESQEQSQPSSAIQVCLLPAGLKEKSRESIMLLVLLVIMERGNVCCSHLKVKDIQVSHIKICFARYGIWIPSIAHLWFVQASYDGDEIP